MGHKTKNDRYVEAVNRNIEHLHRLIKNQATPKERIPQGDSIEKRLGIRANDRKFVKEVAEIREALRRRDKK